MENPPIVLPLQHLAPPIEAYAVTVKIGEEEFHLIIDTGSPDTWVARNGYTGLPEGSSDEESTEHSTTHDNNPCNMGTLFNPDAANFAPIDDAEFQFGYESREKAHGSIGRVLVFSLGAYACHNALLEVASELNWTGKSVESGVLGLAGPASQVINHGGIPLSNPHPDIKAQYDSLITEIFQARPGQRVFTLALGRASAPSAIAFFGRTANVLAQFNNIQTNGNSHLQTDVSLKGHALVGEWLIKPSSYKFFGPQMLSADNGDTLALVDSGDELIRLPSNVANMFHSLWTPPLTSLLTDEEDRIIVPANATPPSLVITINGVAFTVESQDLKLTLRDGCRSAVQSSDNNSPQTLGLPFLKNVIAEFDIDNKKMVFYQRRY